MPTYIGTMSDPVILNNLEPGICMLTNYVSRDPVGGNSWDIGIDVFAQTYIYNNKKYVEVAGEIYVFTKNSQDVWVYDTYTTRVTGVVRTNPGHAIELDNEGELVARNLSYSEYSGLSISPFAFVSKGTLDNVIIGRKLVKDTDYASQNTGGVIKANTNGFLVSNAGVPSAKDYTYSQYGGLGNNVFISKATLDNVITGKGLVGNTDYADYGYGGVIEVNPLYGTKMNNGSLACEVFSYYDYDIGSDFDDEGFVSRGTLRNVLAEEIGDIASILDAINGEVI